MKSVRIGLCALLAFAVLAHGVVEPWSEAVLETGAAVLFLWWGTLFVLGRLQRVRWNRLLWPIIAFWLLAVVQFGARFTAVSFLTKIEILKLSALGLLFFLAVQAFETREDWRAFAWFLLVLGFAVSVFGIIQHYAFNGKLYWFRELRYGGIPFGPYVNRNHFAGFVELIIPVGLSILLLRSEDRDRLSPVVLLTIVPVGALFLSASRGGIAALLFEVGLVFILGLVRGEARKQKQIVSSAIVFLAAGAFIVWLGAGRALERFEAYQKLEVSQARRAEMLRDSWRIFLDHPLLGTGLGTLEAVFPRYETLYDGTIVNHSHNDYVELLAETGAIGGLICACFLMLLLGGAWRRIAGAKNAIDLALHIGALSACCALLAHSFVDFNLHIPSNALLFLLQSALATSTLAPAERHMARNQEAHSRKLNMTRAVQTV
jgi:O-antigen ligase